MALRLLIVAFVLASGFTLRMAWEELRSPTAVPAFAQQDPSLQGPGGTSTTAPTSALSNRPKPSTSRTPPTPMALMDPQEKPSPESKV
jgi:hypothetical protein